MRFRILLLMASKNEQGLKQHCHPYQKIEEIEIPSLNTIFVDLLTANNLPNA